MDFENSTEPGTSPDRPFNVCPAARVECWQNCKVVEKSCEFCGMCDDSDCRKMH